MRELIVRFRRLLVVLVHVSLWSSALVFAFLLRFDFLVPADYWTKVPAWLGVLLITRVVTHWWWGMFHGMWRYTGIRDVVTLVKASTVSTLVFAVATQVLPPAGFPRSIYVIEWLMSVALVGGLRFGIRAIREIAIRNTLPNDKRTRILVVGAGDAGEVLIREIRGKFSARFEPVGFVDDNPSKQLALIHGVPVLGPIAKVPDLVQAHTVDEVIVAIPSATASEMRRIVDLCARSGATVRTLPGMDGLIDGRVTVNAIRAVAIDDLLGREAVQLETEAIAHDVQGRCVAVTGAGGSIGSELCRQLCAFGPGRLLLIERAENALFNVHRQLAAEFPDVECVPLIADVGDARRVREILAREQPRMLFHAAAHKHVPMMEHNPGEAVKNNVLGTKTLADLAALHGVEKFVMISTDKAVNPTSVMGASKRSAELYLQSLAGRTSTQFITVRFGNVLGSAGSVIPLFQEMIARGGPVLVTHPDMKRYFMTIPEAAQLVIQAGVQGQGGEIFVLDMGEPVKIVDLARDLIKLSGLREGDIEIRFTGLRPGEKLFEELSLNDENADKTRHSKIFIGRIQPARWENVEAALHELEALADRGTPDEIRDGFARLVPEYRPGGRRSAPPPLVSASDAPSDPPSEGTEAASERVVVLH